MHFKILFDSLGYCAVNTEHVEKWDVERLAMGQR